jgi:hypothetical protein
MHELKTVVASVEDCAGRNTVFEEGVSGPEQRKGCIRSRDTKLSVGGGPNRLPRGRRVGSALNRCV